MKARALTFFTGLAALAAGFVAGRLLRGGGDEDAASLGIAPGADTAGVAAAMEKAAPRVHPELLAELRRLVRAADPRSFAGLRARDFPAVLLEAAGDGDRDTVEALFRRWAELDTEGILRYFLAQGRIAFPSGPGGNPVYADELFRVLAARDPREAMAAALRFPKDCEYANVALQAIAAASPELAVALALENLGGLPSTVRIDLGHPEANIALARALAGREPFGAVESSALDRIAKEFAMEARLEVWKSLPPEARARTASAFLPGLDEDDGSAMAGELYALLSGQLGEGAELESELAVRFISIFSGRILQERGFAGTLEWVAAHFEADDTTYAMSECISRALEEGAPLDGMFAALAALPPGNAKDGAAWGMAWHLASSDPQAALEWAVGLPPDHAAGVAMRELATTWGREVPDDAEAAARALPAGYHADAFVRGLAQAQDLRTPLPDALAWAGGLPADRVEAAMVGLGEAWMRDDDDPYGDGIDDEFKRVAQLGDFPHRDALLRAMVALGLEDGPGDPTWLGVLEEGDRDAARQAIRASDLDEEDRARANAALDGGGE